MRSSPHSCHHRCLRAHALNCFMSEARCKMRPLSRKQPLTQCEPTYMNPRLSRWTCKFTNLESRALKHTTYAKRRLVMFSCEAVITAIAPLNPSVFEHYLFVSTQGPPRFIQHDIVHPAMYLHLLHPFGAFCSNLLGFVFSPPLPLIEAQHKKNNAQDNTNAVVIAIRAMRSTKKG